MTGLFLAVLGAYAFLLVRVSAAGSPAPAGNGAVAGNHAVAGSGHAPAIAVNGNGNGHAPAVFEGNGTAALDEDELADAGIRLLAR